MKQLKCEIIAIGTELLLGQIANTNAKWLSEQLASYGIDTYYHTVVGDNYNRVKDVFKQAQNRSNVMIVSGGLGPTEDDMTRDAFQQLTGLDMVEHAPSMHKIEEFYNKQQEPMPENNRRQARVFEGAEVIPNHTGMAPGMIVSYEGATWIFLPGVPSELMAMCEDAVFPYLMNLTDDQMMIRSTTLRFIGIGESKLEEDLKDLIQGQTNPTIAPLAQNDGVVIRITAKDSSEEKALQRIEETKQLILARINKHFFGVDNETIEQKVFDLLSEQNKRIAAAESITGGKFIERLISFPGAFEVSPGGIVCYDSDVKVNVLNVSPDTIKNDGAVSETCALEMARNACKVLPADIGISFTGEAGPHALEDTPVGTVFIALVSSDGHEQVDKFVFQGERNKIRDRATVKGYELLFNYLTSKNAKE